MDKLHIQIPVVNPIGDEDFVIVPSKAWNALCDTLNSVANVVNIQTDAIGKLATAIEDCHTNHVKNSENITKLAKIIGDIYETLE